ncbi:Transcription factor TFIIH complex subunit Tfb2 [Taphrina deformans PYCC 5710]|uniref:RNA polymerase II transcription factor B subunit 2 n=1 Tax=Taphrina deformans (strain PYCC 5710 / ATCC 11124 / CBS 356.35 / IMI 108563 / JCM 9778 / NBRC 8474) TaxID=1097556 RepID=R4XAU2_TAPDE|nr:Transcription factor TFIIH complex subunit Tfb2 [Taphrina deformans PYCC 5710]|eukprot:CCG82938.1 Transcription factor TFIIH complex subunit Tfb2 [Taphrina deformans PYCC 5710]
MAVTEFRTSINDYLEQLPPTTNSRLYSRPATCLAIFRLLPAMAKHYVTSLLFTTSDLSMTDFEQWSTEQGRSRQSAAFDKLQRLNIMTERGGNLVMNDGFRLNMKLALTGGGKHNSFGLPTMDHENVDVQFLEKFCTTTWEDILHFMVGTTFNRQPGSSVVRLLRASSLIDDNNRITSAGFQFLLQDGNAQIWTLILQYLETSDVEGCDPVEMIHFLFMLGSLEVGVAYSASELSLTQASLLADLMDFGIIWQKSGSDSFWPTRLASTLNHDASITSTSTKESFDSIASTTGDDSGFVILETNYRLYAYTSSPLQIAVLDLFTDLNSRFPNLCTGQLSRHSIRKALDNGITADQVILFLTSHAHPQMRKQLPLLPPTVVDQIRLWELEKNRLKATIGYLFRDFNSAFEFEEALKYARDIGVLVYDNKAKRFFFVSTDGVQLLTAFVKRKAEERKLKGQ